MTTGSLAAIAIVAAAFLLRDPGGGEPRTTTTSPTATTASSAGGAAVPDFDADFDGAVGEGQELIDWLGGHEGRAVHLDLSFADPPAGTDSPPFWLNCSGLLSSEQPSTEHCDAWVLHIRSDDPSSPPFPESRGLYHLEGYFLVATTSGPHQGYYSLALDPVSAEAAARSG